jgi:hypothetical protein
MGITNLTQISVDYRDRTTGKLLFTQQETRNDAIANLRGIQPTPANGKATVYLEPSTVQTHDASGKVLSQRQFWGVSPGQVSLSAQGWTQAVNTDRFVPADSRLRQANQGLPALR